MLVREMAWLGKALGMQAQWAKFNPWNPHKKLSPGVHICNANTLTVRWEVVTEAEDQLAWSRQCYFQDSKELCCQQGGNKNWVPTRAFWFVHALCGMSAHTQINVMYDVDF